MNTFLQETIADIYKKEHNNLHDICIVVPGKRVGIHIQRCLSNLIDKPVFLPQIATINELVPELSGINVIEPFLLVYKLYQVYIKHSQSTETFEEFYYWGEMLLNDFDDIDKYYIPAKDIFSNIEAIKDIDKQFSYLSPQQIDIIRQFWGSFIADKLSIQQEEFYRIWKILYPIYIEFTELLKKEGVGYEGIAYRKLVDEMPLKPEMFKKTKYVFIGFNALNECEHKIFGFLKKESKARFYWDSDIFYHNDTIHEAGYFIRNNVKRHGTEVELNSNNLLQSKQIDIVSAPASVIQVKHLANVLRHWQKEGAEFSECAIILCDEQMLLPLLYSLPEEVNSVNITMGLPLKLTPVYNSISLIVQVHTRKTSKIIFKDVQCLVNDVLLGLLIPESIKDQVNNFAGHAYDVFEPENAESFMFQSNWEESEFIENMQYVILQLTNAISNKEKLSMSDKINLEGLFILYKTTNKLKQTIAKVGNVETKLIVQLLRKALAGIQIPFVGEPLIGLQIMGILESRLLDFKYVAFVSLNEGIMPSGNTPSSFVPFSLRQGFGLPTIKQRDAIFAYYFYRAIQRAEYVTMLYASQSGDKNLGEMSRYLYQIMYDDRFAKNFKEISVKLFPENHEKSGIEKQESHINKLLNRFDSGWVLTPTALNTFIDCEVKFYYQYIESLRKPDEVLELTDELEFGNIFHKSMHLLYSDYVGKIITTDEMQLLLTNKHLIEKTIKLSFAQIYQNPKLGDVIDGYKLIIFDVVRAYVENALRSDLQKTPFVILGLEEKIEPVEYSININEKEFKVKIGGNIDRIEKRNDTVYIIDYKTGKRDDSCKNLDELFSNEEKYRNGKVLQTLMYSYLYQKNRKEEITIVPQLYFVRDSSLLDESDIYIDKHKITDFRVFCQDFENRLSELISKIFDSTRTFRFTTHVEKCKMCDFKNICGR